MLYIKNVTIWWWGTFLNAEKRHSHIDTHKIYKDGFDDTVTFATTTNAFDGIIFGENGTTTIAFENKIIPVSRSGGMT